jgi:6-phosphofructokinase 1
MGEKFDFTISSLGKCTIESPISLSKVSGDFVANYVKDDEYVRYRVEATPGAQPDMAACELLERGGPREMIYFSPQHVHAGIVTCGGLCPGLNDVIRAIVRCLWYRYGVRRISGIRYGYKGFLAEYKFDVKELNPEVVDDIHKIGGTILGSARGGGKQVAEIVDAMERLNLNMLFTIGGDGTQKGALDIAREIARRRLKIAVVGIPKTVDNDFSFIQKSFGFDTAVVKACEAVTAAHMEAHSQINGVGLVKLMGRDSGFIAAYTALASHEVNFVLIPESPFDVEGENGLLDHLEKRLAARNHAVIVVAEGACQDILAKENQTDASGNKKFGDVGVYLRDKIQAYFDAKGTEINLKYIDPSYIIRASPAVPIDSIYCERLGNSAVHAAMAGKTEVVIGLVNNEFVHLPMEAAVSRRSRVDPEGSLWRDAIEATRQPILMVAGSSLLGAALGVKPEKP